MTTTEAARLAIADMRAGLDQLEAWMDAHPDIEVTPNEYAVGNWTLARRYDIEVMVGAIKDGAPIGAVTKHEQGSNGETLRIERSFGGGIKLTAFADRDEVCTRRVVGTETVQVPDPSAPLVEVEREIVEWDCAPILAGGA